VELVLIREIGKPKKKVRVLAVDDEAEVLQLYDTFLHYKGFEVLTASNAKSCISRLQEQLPDIILLDINMPGIDGLCLLEMIRSEPACRGIPVIMVTAHGDEKTVTKAVGYGCDNFIVKPFKLNDLAKRIDAELLQLTYADVLELLQQPMSIRTAALREFGLQEFDPIKHDPYPVSYGELDFCIILPRGLRPNALLRLAEQDLSKRALIYFRHPLRWKRVWPLFSEKNAKGAVA